MNFSRLLKAAAVIGLVGFASHALAGPETNLVGWVQDFEAPAFVPGSFTNQLEGTSWSYTEGDLSVITNDLVTAFGITEEAFPIGKAFYDAIPTNMTQVLALNTDGNELTFAATTETNATVFVDTFVRMVAGGVGTVAGVSEDVQTAIYLDNTDEENPVLKAFVTGESSNEWVSLFGVPVQDNDWISLRIEIDYITALVENTGQPLATYIVNGITMTNELGESSFVVANRQDSFTKRHVSEVAFRGTGMIDNFSVSQSEEIIALATIVTRLVDTNGAVIDGTPTSQEDKAIGPSSGINQVFDAELEGLPQYIFSEARIRDEQDNVITNFPGDTAEFIVDAPMFEDGKTYYLEGVYAIKQFEVVVNYAHLTTGYIPDGPVTNVVAYGEDFVFDLTALVTDLQEVVVYDEDIQDEVPFTNPTILSNVTANREITIFADWVDPDPGPTEDIVFDTGDNPDAYFEFTEITFADGILTVSFTAVGNVTAAQVTLWVKYSDALVGGIVGYAAVSADVESVEGVIAGTFEIDVGELALPEDVFILGVRTTAPE